MSVFITGDTHSSFERIVNFCRVNELTENDTVVILGDAGVNFYGERSHQDRKARKTLSECKTTIFCIHGNHEQRPQTLRCYREDEWCGGITYLEEAYPNIRFAKDGEVYALEDTRVLVAGGAYSIDKEWRLEQGWPWFSDEQPDDETKARVMAKLDEIGWEVDAVFTHTCPLRYEPTEKFLDGYDQSLVDKSTEQWLGIIEERLQYKAWYCGHYHIKKEIDSVYFLFENFEPLWPGNPEFTKAVQAQSETLHGRSIKEVASDLCVSEYCVNEGFAGQTCTLRKADGAAVLYESDVGAFTRRWLTPRDGKDMQYSACSYCGRWFHKSKLTCVESTDEKDLYLCPSCSSEKR